MLAMKELIRSMAEAITKDILENCDDAPPDTDPEYQEVYWTIFAAVKKRLRIYERVVSSRHWNRVCTTTPSKN